MRRRGELIVASPLRDVFPQTRQAGAVSGASLLLVLYIAPNVVTDNAERWLKSKHHITQHSKRVAHWYLFGVLDLRPLRVLTGAPVSLSTKGRQTGERSPSAAAPWKIMPTG